MSIFNLMNILLASKSPRRKEILESLGCQFEIVNIECNEVFPNEMPVKEVAGYLSKLKADAYDSLKENDVLITADTIVALEDEVLGKPINETDSKDMLRKISGKTHQVYTGVTIKTLNSESTIIDMAEVTLSRLNEEEIDFYIKTFKPFDKAGSYGIQEWLGMAKIINIKGSFYTIMGLPAHIVYEELRRIDANH